MKPLRVLVLMHPDFTPPDSLKGYSEKEKLAIAGNFLLPAALKEVKLDEKVAIGPEVLEHILKEYAREEEGVRELKRCVEAKNSVICSWCNASESAPAWLMGSRGAL